MENPEERKIRIILALNEAKNAAPIGYVCQRCGIDETCESPCRNLRQLEDDGIIQRASPSTWSPSRDSPVRAASQNEEASSANGRNPTGTAHASARLALQSTRATCFLFLSSTATKNASPHGVPAIDIGGPASYMER